MREKVIEYKCKNPSNQKEADLRIRTVVGICEIDSALMNYVGQTGCIHEDGVSFLYQCGACKTLELLDYPFGHSHPGIDEPESIWEKVGSHIEEK